MSVIDVIFNMEADTAFETADAGGCTESYTVKFDNGDNPRNRKMLALFATGIPLVYDSHPYNQWLYVINRTAKPRQNSPLLFDVIIVYETWENPLDEEPEIEWSFASSNEPVDKALDDSGLLTVPVVNSSGESYDPPITDDVDDLVLVYRRNESYFDKTTASSLKGTVNDDPFLGFAPGKVKCSIISSKTCRAASLVFYKITYEFIIRDDGWKRRILDEGFREKTGIDADGIPTYAVNTDADGKSLSQPVLLDGEGKKLADGEAAVFNEFHLRYTNAFTPLNINA